MSLQTWAAEFYPEPAEAAAKRGEAAAVEHSLRKWEGLKAENLDRHDVGAGSRAIYDGRTDQGLSLGGENCALCELRLEESCRICPLYKARDCFACDRRRPDEGFSPWRSWTDNRNPEPMILWLTKAKERCNG